jgi:hypothetical protein
MNKLALFPTQPASESVDGRYNKLCWYALRGDTCPYQTCKNIHLPHNYIDKIIEAKVNEGVALSCKEASSIENELIWKLCLALRKTRLCNKYQGNVCAQGEECIFLHVKGDDAKGMLGKAILIWKTWKAANGPC